MQYHLHAIIASFTDGNKQKKRTAAINAAVLFQTLKNLNYFLLGLAIRALSSGFFSRFFTRPLSRPLLTYEGSSKL